MPNIPTVRSARSTRVGGIEGYASADAFGAQIGAATQRLGGAIGGAADMLAGVAEQQREDARREAAKKRNERLATSQASSAVELNRISLETRQNAPANGVGTADETARRSREYIENTVNAIDDPVERAELRAALEGRAAQYTMNAQSFEFAADAENSKLQADASMRGLENLVRSDASQYGNVLNDGFKVIDAQPGLNEGQRAAMRDNWRERTAQGRFEGALSSAATVEDFDAIEASLLTPAEGEPNFAADLKPETFTAVRNDIAQARKAFATQADAQARAALDGVEERLKSGSVVSPEELAVVAELAGKTSNPVTVRRAFRAQRNQQILTRDATATPEQLRARERAALTGGGGSPAPNLPPRLSTAVNEASQLFPGVSASYLGNTAIREYGQHLKGSGGGGVAADPKYAPTAVHKGVDFSGVRPEVMNAANVAGQIFGRPIPVTSAYRSAGRQAELRANNPAGAAAGRIAKDSNHTHGTGFDVSTAGMDSAEKAKLVDSLVQAGFTGFGEYGTHIHADMRENVANSYNPAGGKMGWTSGSPEVMAVLERRGFASGRSAREIDRSGANLPTQATGVDETDYGRGTSIVGPDGQPTTSVEGVYQFTKGTWLELMNDGSTPQKLGLNLEGLSEAQILELRRDPSIAAKGAAALASKNKAAVEGAIGRPIDDAELYMAHFLGSGGATALINAYEAGGTQLAETLLPQAARSNKPVFSPNGRPLTVKQLYDSIATKYGSAPSAVAYDDAQTYASMASRAEKALSDDPMQYVQSNGVFDIGDINQDGGFAARGVAATAAANYYNIPATDMKVFTAGEASQLTKTLKEGSADDVLAVMARLQELDTAAPGSAKAAYRQLGEEDTALEHAAGLAYEQGHTETASQIVRGQRRIAADPALKEAFGSPGDAQAVFTQATGGALMQLPAGARNAVYESARAHYAETYASQGNFEFDADAFEKSVTAVLGDNRMHEYGGAMMILPAGVEPEEFDAAMDNMTDADLITMSEAELPPLDVDGEPVTVDDIRYEGKFEAIGGNEYRIRMDDNGLLITGETNSVGNVVPFIFVAEPDAIKKLAATPGTAPRVTVGPITVEPDPAVTDMSGGGAL